MSWNVRRQTAGARRETSKVKRAEEIIQDQSHRGLLARSSLLYTYLFGVCLLLFSGCEESFQPLQENNTYAYSIFGYLDASADTQWVRVEPARQEFTMPATVPEQNITLEHLESGTTVVMNDSLVTPGSGFNFLNYWTTLDLEHGQSYRLTAERADGATSSVTVTLPEPFPTPTFRQLIEYNQPITYSLEIFDVERLADVQTWWYVRLIGPNLDVRRKFTFSYRKEARLNEDGSYTVLIDPEQELDEIERVTLLPPGTQIQVIHRQVYIASAGPDWIEELPSLDDPAYAIPNSYSNVENGLGYMIGIDSKIIPYTSCFDDDGLAPCEEEDPFWYE